MDKVKIIFGDYYNDGHGKFDTYYMLCNKNPAQLVLAEKEAEALSGYKFQTNGPAIPAICNEYGDNEVPEEVAEELVALGFNNDVILDDGTVYPLHTLENGIEDFAEFFMRYLQLALPDLRWEWIKDDTPTAIFNCRGYGFYT